MLLVSTTCVILAAVSASAQNPLVRAVRAVRALRAVLSTHVDQSFFSSCHSKFAAHADERRMRLAL
jgi:hypothetical protein